MKDMSNLTTAELHAAGIRFMHFRHPDPTGKQKYDAKGGATFAFMKEPDGSVTVSLAMCSRGTRRTSGDNFCRKTGAVLAASRLQNSSWARNFDDLLYAQHVVISLAAKSGLVRASRRRHKEGV